MKLPGGGVLFSGTSGLVLPFPNKLSYPPAFQDKSRLTFYASLFNSIEVNSSFYKVPMASTVAKWVNEVPVNFRFTFKLWREITHNKGLVFNPGDVENFLNVLDAAKSKAGCLLVQFPPSLKISGFRQLEKLLIAIAEADSEKIWKVALEFRNKSWYEDDVYELIENFGASLVLQDMPLSATPMRDSPENFRYLRFHGPLGNYRESYADELLLEYADLIKDWTDEGKTVYVYFNNTMGEALENLNFINNMVFDKSL